MKVAFIHDHLAQDGGAEKVLEVFQELWPNAPTFTLLFDKERMPRFAGKDIRTSFLQKAPFMRSKYQWYVGLMPTATEQYDLSEYDVVISNASAFSKGVITRPDTLHICYCHTPTRYLWSDTHNYVEDLRVPGFVKGLLLPVLSYLRVWDAQAATRPDIMIANSETVRARIQKYYRRTSTVIHPPVEIERFSHQKPTGDFFLTGGRLVAYKRFDLVVDACNRTGLPLKIFGTGPIENALRKKAGANIEFLGRISDEELDNLYASAKAFIHPQEEDFGITPIESMAAGRPVIAYRKGGATETVQEGVTGEFFDKQDTEELANILTKFNPEAYNRDLIRRHAQQFGKDLFKTTFKEFVEQAWKNHTSTT